MDFAQIVGPTHEPSTNALRRYTLGQRADNTVERLWLR
jgi:hypothetical protein